METYDREKDIQNLLRQDPELTRAEAEAQVDRNAALNRELSAGIPKGLFNSNLSDTIEKSGVNSLATTSDNAKIAREAVEGSKIGLSIGQTSGGFQSLTVTTDEGETVTAEPTVALMTNSVEGNGITVTRTSANKSQISTLTGKVTSDGFLSTVITQGSPKGMLSALKETVKVDEKILKTKVQEASTNPEVASEAVGTDVSTEVVNQVQETNQKLNINLGNPFGSIGDNLSGAAGSPFGNILGNVAGVITGAIKKGSQVTSQVVATNTPSSFKELGIETKNKLNSVTTKFGGDVPQSVPIIKSDGSTNLNQVIKKTEATSNDVKPSDTPVDLSANSELWEGAGTKGENFSALFTYVNSAEEIESELRSAIVDRPMTALMVGSTKSAKNENKDAATDHTDKCLQYLKKFKVESWWNTYVGAPAHYYILTDGSIQRGRPLRIRLTYHEESIGKFGLRTLYVKFCGGLTIDAPYQDINKELYLSGSAYTPEQWKSFEIICKTFKKVVPGGEAISFDEIPDFPKQAGFSARDWTKARFGWETLYFNENDLETRFKNKLGPFEMEEISKYPPEKVAKATATPVEIKPVPAPKPEVVADPETGAPPEKTIEKKLESENELSKVQKQIDKLSGDLTKIVEEKNTLTDQGALSSLTDKYKEIEGSIGALEEKAVGLNTDVYPVTYNKIKINSLESQIAEAQQSGSSAVQNLSSDLRSTQKSYDQALRDQNSRR